MGEIEAYLDDAYEMAHDKCEPVRVRLLDGDFGRSRAYMRRDGIVEWRGGSHDGELMSWDEAADKMAANRAALDKLTKREPNDTA